MIEVYRGSATQWESDEMGHMNVRFYAARAVEGALSFFIALDMRSLARPSEHATVRTIDQHIRFHREARVGEPLVMRCGVVSSTSTDVTLFQSLEHADGRLCATILHTLRHIEGGSGRAFAWPSRVQALFASHACEVPELGQPRSIPSTPPQMQASMARADALNLPVIGLRAMGQTDMDGWGRTRPDVLLGVVSDSVSGLTHTWLHERAALGHNDAERGAVVLEFRLHFLALPHFGDRVMLRTGLSGQTERTKILTHWLLDPDSGKPWCVAQAAAAAFDLKARKLIRPDAEEQAFLHSKLVEGLVF
jgi:acyl-CoA thioester hydrolase